MGNCKEFLSIFLGVAQCGAIAEPISILLTEYEIQPQLEKTGSQLIFVAPAYLPVVERIRPLLPGSENCRFDVRKIRGECRVVFRLSEEVRRGFSPGGSGRGRYGVNPVHRGNDGNPKAVMLTHKNLFSVIQGLKNRFGPLGEMVVLCASPLSHIFGLNTITFASLFRKCPVVLEEWFQVEEAAQLIERYRIANVFGVPTVVRSLTDMADKYDLSCLKLMMTGAAPVAEELYHRVEKTFRCSLVEGWGLTEGAGCSTVTPPGVRKVGSCGIPYEGIGLECAIVDKDDHPCPPEKSASSSSGDLST